MIVKLLFGIIKKRKMVQLLFSIKKREKKMVKLLEIGIS